MRALCAGTLGAAWERLQKACANSGKGLSATPTSASSMMTIGLHPALKSGAYAGCGEEQMTHSNLKVEVHGNTEGHDGELISVVQRQRANQLLALCPVAPTPSTLAKRFLGMMPRNISSGTVIGSTVPSSHAG